MVVELWVLGCWAPYPAPGGACSGYLVGDGDSFVLVECGHGVMARLLGSVGLEQLRAVFLSHLHPDHWYDLPALRHALRAKAGLRHSTAGPLAGSLPLYAPAEPAESFSQIASYTEAFRVHAVPNVPLLGSAGESGGKEKFTVDLGWMTVNLYPARHVLPAYSLEFVCGSKRLFYTGDTAWWDGLPGLAAGADVVLAEASLLAADRPLLPDDHLTAAEAGRLAETAGAKTLLLTHFWPEYDLDDLYREARQHFRGQVALAREGEVYRF